MTPRTAAEHYDLFPYDTGIEDGEVYVRAGGALGRFLAGATGDCLDLGCGPGTLLGPLGRRARHVVAVDVSKRSLELAAARARGLPVSFVLGSALELPLPDASFDRVVAAGSLHHTGDAARGFAELCRVLRPGGQGFVTLYGARSYYELLYRTVGRVARRAERSGGALRLLGRAALLPSFAAYQVAGRAVVHRRLALPSRRQLESYFADQLLHPVVSFHSFEELEGWCRRAGVVPRERVSGHAGGLLGLWFERPTGA